MFFYCSDIDDPLITRKIDFSDNVIPSANSSLTVGLFKLSRILYNDDYVQLVIDLLKNIKTYAMNNPIYHSYWLIAASYLTFPYYEIGIVGDECETRKSEITKKYLPNVILFGSKKEGTLDILKDKNVNNKTIIYVCENHICNLPVENFDSALKQIKKWNENFSGINRVFD